MNIGSHVSIAGGIFNAPKNSKTVGGNIFQIFSRSPRGGPAPEITDEIIKLFKTALTENNQELFYIHTPYYINFGSPKKYIYESSIRIVREELERASALGGKAIMTHLGSAVGSQRQLALEQTAEGLKKLLSGYNGKAMLLLENAAGSGEILGNTFTELAGLINSLDKNDQKKVGVCLDTCHAFASGYDVSTKEDLDKLLDEFDKKIGLDKLIVIHTNDSKTPLGDRKDRHEHIGKGHIGLEGFKNIINHPQLKNVDFILETPIDDDGDHADDIKTIKSIKR